MILYGTVQSEAYRDESLLWACRSSWWRWYMCICSVWHIFGVSYVFGVLLAITQNARESGCIGAAGRGDVSAAVIRRAMSLTPL